MVNLRDGVKGSYDIVNASVHELQGVNIQNIAMVSGKKPKISRNSSIVHKMSKDNS